MKVRVIGCGNPLGSDDGMGLEAARQVEALGLPGVDVCITSRPGSDLLDLLEGMDTVILLDAVSTGAPAGTLHEFTRASLPPAGAFSTSTHGLGVGEILALGRTLKRLPGKLVIMGIEAANLQPGPNLSPAVREALPALLEQVRARLSAFTKEPPEEGVRPSC